MSLPTRRAAMEPASVAAFTDPISVLLVRDPTLSRMSGRKAGRETMSTFNYRDAVRIDGKVFNAHTGKWRTELIGEESIAVELLAAVQI
jgi:hypothetical protein